MAELREIEKKSRKFELILNDDELLGVRKGVGRLMPDTMEYSELHRTLTDFCKRELGFNILSGNSILEEDDD